MHDLFHDDNAKVIDLEALRARARKVILSSSLIKRCLAGDKAAVAALHVGYWPFVSDFEKAINANANSSTLPLQPLYDKFGGTTKKVVVGNARALRALKLEEVEGVFGHLEGEVKKMQKEEYEHSAHWVKDSHGLGISREDLHAADIVPGVQSLVDMAYSKDLVEFFAALGATEFIAEELGDVLPKSSLFTDCFQDKRWVWGLIHVIPHLVGHSHLMIDVDFARAYEPDDDTARIQKLMEATIDLFGKAANDVEAHYCPLAA